MDPYSMRYTNPGILLVSLFLILSSCSSDGQKEASSNDDRGEDGTSHAMHSEMKMEAGEPTDHSIYNVSSSWRNRFGNRVGLDSLKGKVQVVAMVYTHCEFACPRILADMKRIRDRLSGEDLKKTNFVIISIDPERDTPQRLKEFAMENDLTDTNWTLLNGDQGDILEIAALLGVKYKRISESDFTHSNMLSVLNRQGEITFQRKRLGDNPSDIVAAIEKAAS